MTTRPAATLRAAQNQACSLHAFTTRKAAVDGLLERLTAASGNHFGTDPDAVLWAEEASLAEVEALLRRAIDFIGA